MKIYTVNYLFNGPDTDSIHAEVVGVATTLEQAKIIMRNDFDYQKLEYQKGRECKQGFFDMVAHIETDNERIDWNIQEFDLPLNQENATTNG